MKAHEFKIRYHNMTTSDNDRWRAIIDGNEIHVANIIINTKSWTSCDQVAEGEKFHISAIGQYSLDENNVLTIFE